MRLLQIFLASALMAVAESHPAWWLYAAPDATALVGIDLQKIRLSPFAAAVNEELSGSLGFPDLACLKQAKQVLISSPDVMAVASGTFPAEPFRERSYRGVGLWISPAPHVLSVARISDQVVLIGTVRTLRAAIDRSLSDLRPRNSPLLVRAARYSKNTLWVVSARLPDPLASLFVPLEAEAQSFEGFLEFDGGLEVEAAMGAGSVKEAGSVAQKLMQSVPTFPLIARGLEVEVEEDTVMLSLSVTSEQLSAGLRRPETSAPAPPPGETIRVSTPQGVQSITVEKAETVAVVEKKSEAPVEKAPEKPQVVRILGLDEGPREVVLPPSVAKPEKQ